MHPHRARTERFVLGDVGFEPVLTRGPLPRHTARASRRAAGPARQRLAERAWRSSVERAAAHEQTLPDRLPRRARLVGLCCSEYRTWSVPGTPRMAAGRVERLDARGGRASLW